MAVKKIENTAKECSKEYEMLLKKYWDTKVATDIIKAFELGRRLGALTLKKK